MGFKIDDGDVEAAIRSLNIPIMFIAGTADRRMPPALAEKMFNAAPNPKKQLLLVPNAGHGEAFRTDREKYMTSVFGFIESSGT
jgi:pimeloyl-ACP methyl ester carboxylesterase